MKDQFDKPIKAKPTFYAHCFFHMKAIALEYGYNLVIHGSMDRDLDLIAIPWQDEVKESDEMIDAFCEYLDGLIIIQGPTGKQKKFAMIPGGRKSYLIDLRRGETHRFRNWIDAEYYMDISVTPHINDLKP